MYHPRWRLRVPMQLYGCMTWAREPLSSARMSWPRKHLYRPADEANGRLWRGGFFGLCRFYGEYFNAWDSPMTGSPHQRQETMYGFHLPDPVPDDLLMPLGVVISKYNISGMPQMMLHGYGNILQQPTLYVMKSFGLNMLWNLLEDGFFYTSNWNHQRSMRKLSRCSIKCISPECNRLD